MVIADDYYQLLGVSRGASSETLKRAFHTRVKHTHPDINHFDDDAHEATRRIIEAYQTLSDARRRLDYDMATVHSFVSETSGPHVSFSLISLLNTVKRLLACAVLIVGTAILARTIVQDRPPVFKAVLIDQQAEAPLKDFPAMVEPSPFGPLEWYQVREYQLTLASGWARSVLIDTYSHAARKAARRGDGPEAAFYRDAIRRLLAETPKLKVQS